MPLSVTPLHPLFGAEISGLDLSLQNAALRDRVEALMDQNSVCVFEAQDLDPDQQVAFGRLFGPLEQPASARGNRGEKTHRLPPEIFPITNMDGDGNFQKEDDAARLYRLGNELWHSDSSFRQTGATYSMLHAKIIPPVGADTEFTDTRAVFDALPEAQKLKLQDLVAEHSIWHSRAQQGGYTPTEEERRARPPAHHPLVRTNPRTGLRSLFIAAHVSHIAGWPIAEGRKLIGELLEFATQPRFVYRHVWTPGDMVIWDNRCTMHRATPFEDFVYKRDLRRTTVREYESVTA